MATDFAGMIAKERDRLNAARQEAQQRKSAIDAEIADIDRELKAITAYETAKTGKAPAAQKSGGKRSGSRQDGILQLLANNTDGLSRGEILDKLGLKGDKAAEQSVSNALNNMKKAGKLGSNGGKYVTA